MSTFLTTISILIAFGLAIETTTISVVASVEIETSSEPPGQLPPPPTE